jgi:serine/threonine protein kinase
VVIKKLITTTTADDIQREVDTHQTILGFQSDHIIKAFASYCIRDEQYIMMPFAEHGNLWEFMTGWQPFPPRDQLGYVENLLKEVHGLASALAELHGNKIRHGDLKPENILCFKSKVGGFPCGVQGDKCDDPHCRVRLVISDVGLARKHDKPTQLRESTQTMVSTKRYMAPEMALFRGASLSRKADVWSMGCLFLELAVWLMYGAEDLKNFTTGHSEFYETVKETGLMPRGKSPGDRVTARLHTVVKTKISEIEKSGLCETVQPLRFLIGLVGKEMMEPEPGVVGDEGTQSSPVSVVGITAEPVDPAHLIPIVLRRATEPRVAKSFEKYRATAEEVERKMQKICDCKPKQMPPFENRCEEAAPPTIAWQRVR